MSTASSTPAGGWYADPLDASLLRWWDGATWTQQTMSADPALSPSNAAPRSPLTAVPPLLTAVPPIDEPYVPANSVFRMAETAAADAYVPEWSGFVDISDEVALTGVPVQLALTSTPTEPPIPVSADVFPTLRPESPTAAPIKEPVWKVEAPLAAPVDQLFPVAPAPPVAPVPPIPPAPPAVFPVAAPAAPVAHVVAPVAPVQQIVPVAQVAPEPVAVPHPAGDAFPGLVPSVGAPVAPAPVLYAGPPPTAVGADPVAPPEFQPFAASTPGASYVPLTPRPIPKPLQLGAPAAAPSAPSDPSQLDFAGASPAAASAPTASPVAAPAEYWPTQGAANPVGQYQPNPGDYIPFDPNSVHLEPVPVIPFSSRDPYNSASTARPGMRAYAAAPVGPTGSTWTGGLAFILFAPLITTAVFFVWSQLTTTVGLSLESVGWLPVAIGAVGLMGLAAAQIDRNALARRGYFDLASPFWVLLIPPLIYLIVRATRLRGQGRGAGPAIGLWALSYVAANVLMGVIALSWLSAATPARVALVETAIQHQLAAKNITATVNCPAVTSLAPGSSFDCTVLTQGASLPIRVTVSDWEGGFTATPISASTT